MPLVSVSAIYGKARQDKPLVCGGFNIFFHPV
jgi:hypothetical protein